jgi:hypothetical protein
METRRNSQNNNKHEFKILSKPDNRLWKMAKGES